ncbi:MltA-interacting MipA family protein [Photobacterium sanctipauli]|uniref:MltA-interacting MipA family protein n=1 Tax=Photobacterium sanctipauli TaxID=1342794 RepID=A0A2T3NIK0_9GAMM|nr:MltA-interacting MipA family protein [Photobacterium sanctipauli]
MLCCVPLVVSAEDAQTQDGPVADEKAQGFISVHDLRAKRGSEQQWGIAAVFRGASIPYSSAYLEGINSDPDRDVSDSSVYTFVPMMFYQGERLFINGTEGGLNLYREDNWEVNLFTRLHFIDIPSSVQNDIGGDTADMGLQYKYLWTDDTYTEFELLSDPDGRLSSQFTLGSKYGVDNWQLRPELSLTWKETAYNSYYYGLNRESVHAGVDLRLGVAGSYHVASNLYLLGGAHLTYFDKNVRDSVTMSSDGQAEAFLGFGFFNDQDKPRKSSISTKPYFRVAHGRATPSNMGDIFSGKGEKDEFNNQLTSIFYGHPLTDELFGIPLDIYLTPGFVWHWSSDVQSTTQEYVMAIKAYYTVNWPVKWRFGVAEGLSYITDISYIEAAEMERKDYEPSNLLNYLDFSFDVNLGDLFNEKSMDGVWVGYSLHHRSAIFENASQFGRIKGGSNYNTIYVQFDF